MSASNALRSDRAITACKPGARVVPCAPCKLSTSALVLTAGTPVLTHVRNSLPASTPSLPSKMENSPFQMLISTSRPSIVFILFFADLAVTFYLGHSENVLIELKRAFPKPFLDDPIHQKPFLSRPWCMVRHNCVVV